MHLRSISIGHAVPRRQFEAVVHSVFASAVNVKPVDRLQLLTLLASDQGDLPQAIRLEACDPSPFASLRAGTRATCSGGLLVFEEHPLMIDLREAPCWDSSLETLHVDMRAARVQAAWKRAWQALNERQAARASELQACSLLSQAAGDQAPWMQQASCCMRSIVRATSQSDPEDSAAIEGLVGLGPGLTPAGDDLLAGYLLGLHYAVRGRQQRIDFLSRLARAVLGCLPRTGDISGTYLYYAAIGKPPRDLFGLARAVCSGADEPALLASAQAAMQVGHTSGMDAVTGLLMGLAIWEAPELAGLPAAV